MPDDEDDLPSDAEKGSLTPKPPMEQPVPPPEERKEEADPSEQPS